MALNAVKMSLLLLQAHLLLHLCPSWASLLGGPAQSCQGHRSCKAVDGQPRVAAQQQQQQQ
jgi:hypothetical protein